ncbi:MAG: hypothetical protein QN149_13075 [Armatimonadota bacterium]|nr:hypothetical protein [Armatimonadota bacterium]MDR7468300.1 hypothetical protein [Armatimonadota bacterium]MDR7494692.1 hypothetical protein [Armatimonadota bacterium]MDR7500238.1 hypothetical protein [Armatimonadota bacterium]MDR7548198.1 hypothetical protein [Armatimonadota bacterium]
MQRALTQYVPAGTVALKYPWASVRPASRCTPRTTTVAMSGRPVRSSTIWVTSRPTLDEEF